MINVAKLLVQIYKAQLAMHEIGGNSKNMTFFPYFIVKSPKTANYQQPAYKIQLKCRDESSISFKCPANILESHCQPRGIRIYQSSAQFWESV